MLCIKVEINQGYTTMYGQSVINIRRLFRSFVMKGNLANVKARNDII
jgi:hypothetical protein